MKSDIIIGEVGELGISSKLVCQFYENNWNRKISLGIFQFYNWQFCLPPENSGADSCCVAIDGNGDVLGVMGLNKRSFYLNSEPRKGAELTTWIVSEKARGRGVGGKIMNFLQSHYDVLLGMGITDAAIPIYFKSNFRFLRYIPRFVRVYDQKLIAKYTEIKPLTNQLINRWSKINNVLFDSTKVYSQSLSTLEKHLTSNFNHFTRNDLSLSWRYTNHPIYNYQSYIIKGNGEGLGIIFRIEEIDSLRIMHIVEYFGDFNDFSFGFSFIDRYCEENNVSVADFYCPSPVITKYFVSSGWFSVLDDYFFQFMHLFYPPELRVPPTTSLIYWSRYDNESLLDTSKLYVTKGDLDLDRPTGQYYDSTNTLNNNFNNDKAH